MNHTITETHISQISIGDTIISKDGFMRTITKQNLNFSSFMGNSINGDSYQLGTQLVKKVIFNKPQNN
jgi:hypothetical protein